MPTSRIKLIADGLGKDAIGGIARIAFTDASDGKTKKALGLNKIMLGASIMVSPEQMPEIESWEHWDVEIYIVPIRKYERGKFAGYRIDQVLTSAEFSNPKETRST